MLFKQRLYLLWLVPFLSLSACGTSLSSSSDESSQNSENTIPIDYEFDDVERLNSGAYYEIFVRSFADTDEDGVGDFTGIKEKMSYLSELGVGGIWLMPIHPSPSYHGYDVNDYMAVNPEYGTLAEFSSMIDEADKENIDVIIDLVLNHSASTHPWFIEGKENFRTNNYDENDPDNKANWYNFDWVDGTVRYEAGFGDWMPDLNLDNPSVRAEIEKIAEFWLDLGVSGFRLDAVTYFYTGEAQKSIDFLSWFKGIVEAKKPDAYIVGEAWTDQNTINLYYNGIDSLFNFPGANSGGYIIDNLTSRRGSSIAFQLANTYASVYEKNEDALVATFLSNHDMDRSSQMFIMDHEGRQKVAASIYLLSPGVPFMYYGEEIGIKGSRGSAQTDANRRLPMLWQWGDDPWRTDVPVGTDYPMANQVREGVYDLLDQPFSLTNHYKKVLNVRNQYPWLRQARIEHVTLPNNLLAGLKYTSKDGEKQLFVVHNIDRTPQTFAISRLGEQQNLAVVHDIFASQERVQVDENDSVTLGAFSSVVIEER